MALDRNPTRLGTDPVCWALVPARGRSKSIVRKNLAEIEGVPLLDFGVRAAIDSSFFARIVCSTDDDEIGVRARYLGIEVDRRPDALATDTAAVADVGRDFLKRAAGRGDVLPDILVLVQPTSPFLRPEDCRRLVRAMSETPSCNSGQTICLPPHNHHAYNQRVLEHSHVSFHFRAERQHAFNKQLKPLFYIFGNLVAVRPRALLAGSDFFAEPSIAIVIERPYDLDVDTMVDIEIARALVAGGKVSLPHMLKAAVA